MQLNFIALREREREREREGFVLYVGVTELLGILYGKRRRMQEMKEVSQGNMSHMREKAKKSQLKLSDKEKQSKVR